MKSNRNPLIKGLNEFLITPFIYLFMAVVWLLATITMTEFDVNLNFKTKGLWR